MKMWKILETCKEHEPSEINTNDNYQVGYEEGYRKAMKEAYSFYENKIK